MKQYVRFVIITPAM